MEDGVSDEEKRERMKELLEVQRGIASEGFRRFIGRTLTVLFESDGGEGMCSGKSDEFIIVEAKADSSVIGSRKQVKITKAFNWALQGEII